ncbi:hypothetical protein RHSIM_Rhsim10G0116300 [Rhododendron simsii]|uniref:Reverse transcriptase domain-containing protein n=1 Tax=Rhododendron simsii TaxID=118357 RepID=A0A834GFI1_RHOSS|nr:hypothetical protein RHSIM_Rhsim10G0116300 [Rhododendron simsii]
MVERRRRNHVSGIENEQGIWVSDQQSITTEFQKFFTNLHVSEAVHEVQQVTSSIPTRITADTNNRLFKPFSTGEIKTALFAMHPNKASGYDGMTAGFIQRYWDIVGVDVCRALCSFFHDGRMLGSVNCTQIILIPKVHTPTKVSQFHPISLCTTVYKLIAKVLANRLRPFLSAIISKNQSAFVGGRQITDNVLITNELTHYIKHKRSGTQSVAAFKLDMVKAYDQVEWSYLERVMAQLGFHQKWIGWVMECIRTISSEVSQFWWGSKEGERKIHWIKWHKLSLCKGDGDLGLPNMESFNKALLPSRVGNLSQANHLCFDRSLKDATFPGLLFGMQKIPVSLIEAWRSIVWAWELIDKGWKWQVHSGNEIRVWEDLWLPRHTNYKIDRDTLIRNDIKTVADLIDSSTKTWKVALVREVLVKRMRTIFSQFRLAIQIDGTVRFGTYHQMVLSLSSRLTDLLGRGLIFVGTFTWVKRALPVSFLLFGRSYGDYKSIQR